MVHCVHSAQHLVWHVTDYMWLLCLTETNKRQLSSSSSSSSLSTSAHRSCIMRRTWLTSCGSLVGSLIWRIKCSWLKPSSRSKWTWDECVFSLLRSNWNKTKSALVVTKPSTMLANILHETGQTCHIKWSELITIFLYTVSRKGSHKTRQIWTDFQNSFTGWFSSKYAAKWLLKIPPHLKCVATLPCEMSSRNHYAQELREKAATQDSNCHASHRKL